jgi:hypothetical protein
MRRFLITYKMKFVILIILSISVVSGLRKMTTAATNTGFFEGHVPFFFKSLATDGYLQVNGSSTANDAVISQWAKVNSNHLLWIIKDCDADNFCYIKNALTGKCLHLRGSATTDNAVITQWDCINQANLKWKFNPVGDNIWRIESLASHKCVHVPSLDKPTINGIGATQWTCIDQSNLNWTLEPHAMFP